MNTKFTTHLLTQLNALVAGLTDEESDRIASGALTLALSLHEGAAKTKTLGVKGKKPKAVQMAASMDEAVDAIRTCQGRQQTRDLLKDLSLKIGDLKEVISSLGNIPTGKKKSELENQIVEIIGRQADSRAMR
ncbi:MAG: hypothetical protein ACOYM3_21275 [Terrimicrobiaceae bacterium]